jgi:hypothetical protein
MPPPKRKKEPTVIEEREEKPMISSEINISELFEKLREFDNKVLLERLQVLERNVTLLYKEQLNNRAVLNEIQQTVSYLAIAHEELLNSMGLTLETDSSESSDNGEEMEEETSPESIDKKWN